MIIEVGAELAEAGVAPAGSSIEILSEEKSAAGTTVSCAVGGRFAWLERRSGAAAPLDRSVAAAVRDALASLPDDPAVRTALPFVTGGGVAVYASLPGPTLLAEVALLADAGAARRWRRLPAESERLGGYLAGVHRHGRRAQLPAALLRPTPAMGRVGRLLRRNAPPQPTVDLERLQELLLVAEPDLTRTLLELVARSERSPAATLLHGQFAPGFVVPATDAPEPCLAVIGWLDAGAGPSAVDLGTFVGELAELASAWRDSDPDRAEVLEEAARRFVRGYAEASDQSGLDDTIAAIGPYSAVKIVDHLLAHCTYFGFPEDSARVMAGWARAALERDWTAVA